MSDELLFTPNRAERRRIAGLPCCACNDPMTQADVQGVRTDEAVLWMHSDCVAALLRNGAETEGPE